MDGSLSSSDAAASFTEVNIMRSWGCILVGTCLSAISWGVACMQMFLYFLIYDKDNAALKSFVVFVWAFTTLDLVLSIASMFPVLILHWGSANTLLRTQTLLNHHGWVSAIVAFSVQMFFVYRIHRFSGRKWCFPAVIFPFALWELVGSIPLTIWLDQQAPLSDVAEMRNIKLEIAGRSVGAFVDIMITSAMVYLLAKNRQPDIRRSNKMIYRLIIMTVNTGMWTAVIALVDVALIAAFTDGLQLFAVDLPLNPIYLNMLLANLNARRLVRNVDGINMSLESRIIADLALVGLDSRSQAGTDNKYGHRRSLAIRVETMQTIHEEEDSEFSKSGEAGVLESVLTVDGSIQQIERSLV
ncbi:hypothetical protein GSI_10326 [Ganoderma sinense ZZ0214-1]|uniref:DUF6534 domain-containing protein n=1 Tax=Ganoderma sinense ZZ0214-1 TaxID=1077348 RepID=A0A2G8S0B7_9APHY|nr:hypothetical protein GSI_10326 [Ganoderma sinense ZZ0214-1]